MPLLVLTQQHAAKAEEILPDPPREEVQHGITMLELDF